MSRFKLNKVIADMLGYYYYLRGVEKSGKTTLFRNIVIEKFGNPEKGLLVAFGDEDGYKALDNLQVEHIEPILDDKGKIIKTAWSVFVSLVDDLVKNKTEYGIELIGLDTYDELAKIGIAEVIRLSNIETPTKPCKSINGAFGGFNGGFEKLAELLEAQLYRLRKAGYTLFAISHTKYKTIKEKGMNEEDSYNMLTSNLDSRIDNIIAHKADVIATIYIDKEVEDGRLKGSKRYIYFRSDGFVNAGCRFKDIEERVELSAKNFITAIENGIKNSKTQTDEQYEAIDKRNSTIEIPQEITDTTIEIDIERNKEIYSEIEKVWKTTPKEVKENVKKLMTENNVEKISDVENNPTSFMESALKLIK
jgi:hypothetical protein